MLCNNIGFVTTEIVKEPIYYIPQRVRITMLLLQEDVMFRYFVQDSSVIIGVLEEPFIDDGMVTICVYNGVICSLFVLTICFCYYDMRSITSFLSFQSSNSILIVKYM